MIWLFEREEATLQLETRVDDVSGEYLSIVRWPDGTEQVDRFQSAVEFGARLRELEDELEAANWKQRGGPIILPDGWPKKRPH
jgi:hypothetical protein